MKRYRVLHVTSVTFDTRPEFFQMAIEYERNEEVREDIRRSWIETKEQIAKDVRQEYGITDLDRKLLDFVELGMEPFSILAFHNKFLRQCRNAFIGGSYYPALTGACALGERILNHMVLKLRDSYKGTPSYKKVYDKKSFDNWNKAIDPLEEWQVFANGVADLFRELCELRNDSLHFRIELDEVETREPALRAIRLLQDIVAKQFGVNGLLPWFVPGTDPFYIKKELEDQPFIREFYLPSCVHVGPNHRIRWVDNTWQVYDPGPYEDREISDEEFAELVNAAKTGGKG